MAVPHTRRRFRGLARARIKLCRRILQSIQVSSVPVGPRTVFQIGDIAAAAIILDALGAALAATDPR